MSVLPVELGVTAHWDFAYDDEWFIPLPSYETLHGDSQAAAAWVDEAVEHYASRVPLTDGDRDALAFTAEGLLSLVTGSATQLWFTPRGVYSDVFVEINVADVAALDADTLLREIAALPDAAGSELIALETETHGKGFLLRRTSAVDLGDQARPIANWTVLLRQGEWAIMIEVMGSTLEPFALMDEQILRLIEGITLPTGGVT